MGSAPVFLTSLALPGTTQCASGSGIIYYKLNQAFWFISYNIKRPPSHGSMAEEGDEIILGAMALARETKPLEAAVWVGWSRFSTLFYPKMSFGYFWKVIVWKWMWDRCCRYCGYRIPDEIFQKLLVIWVSSLCSTSAGQRGVLVLFVTRTRAHCILLLRSLLQWCLKPQAATAGDG